VLPDVLRELVEEVQREARQRAVAGTVNVYYLHRKLTPGTVRAAHKDVARAEVPREGQIVRLPGAGKMGAHVTWLVDEVVWGAGHTVAQVYCVDPPRRPWPKARRPSTSGNTPGG